MINSGDIKSFNIFNLGLVIIVLLCLCLPFFIILYFGSSFNLFIFILIITPEFASNILFRNIFKANFDILRALTTDTNPKFQFVAENFF